MEKIKVGDRVIILDSFNEDLIGKKGTVRYIKDPTIYIYCEPTTVLIDLSESLDMLTDLTKATLHNGILPHILDKPVGWWAVCTDLKVIDDSNKNFRLKGCDIR